MPQSIFSLINMHVVVSQIKKCQALSECHPRMASSSKAMKTFMVWDILVNSTLLHELKTNVRSSPKINQKIHLECNQSRTQHF